YLGVAEAAEVGELDHLRLVARQLLQRAADLGGRLAPERLVLGQLTRRPLLEDRFVVEVELGRLAGFAAEGVDRPVADDPQRPGAHAAAGAVVAGTALPDRDEGLLGHVLGRAAVADDAVGKRVGGASMAVVEDAEGDRVLLPDQRHQLLVAESLGLLRCGGHCCRISDRILIQGLPSRVGTGEKAYGPGGDMDHSYLSVGRSRIRPDQSTQEEQCKGQVQPGFTPYSSAECWWWRRSSGSYKA